jgi:hypothetical protein
VLPSSPQERPEEPRPAGPAPAWQPAATGPPADPSPGAEAGTTPPGATPSGATPSGAWPPGSPAPGSPHRSKPRSAATAITAAVAAVACLAAAIAAAAAAHAELVRKPTAAERSRAAAVAVARRWQAWPAGQIFPASLRYTADLDVPETATRVGIDPGTGCAGAVDAGVAPVLRSYGCRAVLRASYLDEREGVVYTIGVVAFGSGHAAAAAESLIGTDPGSGLRPLAIPQTASAWFGDAARQSATGAAGGPYVVLVTAGYADGRPAAQTGEQRPAVFAPAAQLAREVLDPLAAPAFPRCGDPGWTC